MIDILHGKGSQQILTQTYEEDRGKALKDRSKYDSNILDNLEVSFPQGGGQTNDDTFIVSQFPFPVDQSVKRRQKVDIRDDPSIGR